MQPALRRGSTERFLAAITRSANCRGCSPRPTGRAACVTKGCATSRFAKNSQRFAECLLKLLREVVWHTCSTPCGEPCRLAARLLAGGEGELQCVTIC